MAAVPSWEPQDTQQDAKPLSKGSYRCGVIVGANGNIMGEAGLRLMDFSLNPMKGFRKGDGVLSVSTEVGRRLQQTDLAVEKNGVGVSVCHKKAPTRGERKPGWPGWNPEETRSTEGRIYWEPKGVVREVYCRVKKWEEVETPVAAVGGRVKIGGENARLQVLMEGAVTTPFSRLEVAGFAKRGGTELRVGVKNVLAGGGIPPPVGELYKFGGNDVRGYTDTGLLPAASSDTSPTLPATSTAAFSLTRLLPLDPSLGVLFFLDGGAASGTGPVAPNNTLPLIDTARRDRWATPVFLSYGVGLYLPHAPNIRAGMAWGLDKRLDLRGKCTQRFFLSAVGDV